MAAKDVAAHQLARIHDATIGIVAEQGYNGLRIRDVVRDAKVSTRAFYEFFQSKEECFLHTYDLISRRACHRIVVAQADEPDWRKRPQLAFEEFLRGIEHKPHAARLALIEAYAASAASLERAWRTERIFEGMLAEALARTPSGVPVPPLIVEGVVGGVVWVARDRLLADKAVRPADESAELVEWTLTLIGPDAAALPHLDRHARWRNSELESTTESSPSDSRALPGDRARILQATAELAAAKGYGHLTAPRIRTAVGLSRKKFDVYFDSVESCYLDAMEQHTAEALAHATRAQSAAHSWEGGVYRAIAALCERVGRDPFLVRMCLDNDFPASPNGVRSQQRLVAALMELLSSNLPPAKSTVTEASAGALWSLFNHHIIRAWPGSSEIPATLSYLALSPVIGAQAALAAIRSEQGLSPSRRGTTRSR